ncbi:unnamed protein product, partial [Symbiodinium microadriaticum]
MRSLRGLAESWESTDTIRARVRASGSIFQRADGLPHANVKQCGIYSDVMKPLVKIVVGWWAQLVKKRPIFTVFQAECELSKFYRLCKVHVDMRLASLNLVEKMRMTMTALIILMLAMMMMAVMDPRIGSVDEDSSLRDSDVELLTSDDEDQSADVVLDDSAAVETCVVHSGEAASAENQYIEKLSGDAAMVAVSPDDVDTQPADVEDLESAVTRRQQLGVRAGGALEKAVGEDGEDAEKAKPKNLKKPKGMKRPAACTKSSGKRAKDSADVKPGSSWDEEDELPAPTEVKPGSLRDQEDEVPAPTEVKLGSPNDQEDEMPAPISSHDQDEVPAPMVATKPKAKAKSKAKAKAGSKAKAKASSMVKAGKVAEEAEGESDGEQAASDDDFDKATVLFDPNPLHAAFYKGPEDVPFPPSSAEEDSEPEAVPEATGKGRGRGRGGRGRGRGKAGGVKDVAAPDAAPKRGKGGKGKRITNAEGERVTFAKRPMPQTQSSMNLKRFLGIRDAFNDIIRPRVSEAPSKQE